MTTNESRNLSLREAAARLGVAPLTLRRMSVYQGRLPYLKVGRKLLFRPSDLEAVELGCLVPAGPRLTRNRPQSQHDDGRVPLNPGKGFAWTVPGTTLTRSGFTTGERGPREIPPGSIYPGCRGGD